MSKNQLNIFTSAKELEKHLIVAFGPDGRAVMIQHPTGHLSITRSGYRILSSVFPDLDSKEPVQHLLLKCAREVHDCLGDGVKSFVILTSALLKHCTGFDNSVRVMQQLVALQMRLSCFRSQISELPVVVDDGVLKHKIACFETIVNAFFSTRFPAPVYSVLAPLLSQWIISNTSSNIDCFTYQNLKNLLDQFPHLCQYKDGGSCTISESCILNGYRVHRPVINLVEISSRRVQLLMMGDSESAGSGSFDDADIQSEVDKFITEIRNNDHKKDEKYLLITSAILSDLSLFCLKRLNVAVLQGVLPEELNFIFSTLFVLKQKGVSVINVKPVLDRGEQYTLLDFPNIYQLILRAPTTELATEYACTFESALKMCIIAASYAVTSEGIPCLSKVGGEFERTLQTQLIKKGGKHLQDPSSCGIANRAELLTWHKHRLQMESRMKAQQDNENIKISLDTLSLNSVLKYELKPSHNCSHLDKSSCPLNISTYETHYDKEVNSVLCSISDTISEVDPEIQIIIVKALQMMLRKLSPCNSKQSFLHDSVGLRLCILQHSLGATVDLLRICSIIQTKTKLPL